MSKLVLRGIATAVTLCVAGAVTKLVSTGANQEMADVAIGQLSNSNAAQTQFVMLDWLMSSGWGPLFGAAVVVGVLYFIWKGQFNVQK